LGQVFHYGLSSLVKRNLRQDRRVLSNVGFAHNPEFSLLR